MGPPFRLRDNDAVLHMARITHGTVDTTLDVEVATSTSIFGEKEAALDISQPQREGPGTES